MAKTKENKISIPVVVILTLLFFPAAIIYVVVKLGGVKKTSEKVGENAEIIKEKVNYNKYGKLKELKDLLDSGAITEEEFKKEKSKLLK